jgi:sterol 24-C-methyltransferase
MKVRNLYGDASHKGLISEKLSQYRQLFSAAERETEAKKSASGASRSHVRDMTSEFYDLVTDFYELGWGHSFHFAPRHGRESFDASIARHEHFLALRLELRPGLRAIDLGCGVGGPMREIARFSGAQVVGLNINAYQIEKAKRYNAAQGLDDLCELVHGSFLEIPLPDESFDAAYAVEATCHAASRRDVFAEAYRVLKPGGRLAAYEWAMTPLYDENDPRHQAIKHGIEVGNSLPPMPRTVEIIEVLRDIGFEVEEDKDVATDLRTGDRTWYAPLTGKELSVHTLRQSSVGRVVTQSSLRLLERFRLAPAGSQAVSSFLNEAADALVAGGETGIFTPMFYFLARKPSHT